MLPASDGNAGSASRWAATPPDVSRETDGHYGYVVRPQVCRQAYERFRVTAQLVDQVGLKVQDLRAATTPVGWPRAAADLDTAKPDDRRFGTRLDFDATRQPGGFVSQRSSRRASIPTDGRWAVSTTARTGGRCPFHVKPSSGDIGLARSSRLPLLPAPGVTFQRGHFSILLTGLDESALVVPLARTDVPTNRRALQ